jgi:hypothetical protein
MSAVKFQPGDPKIVCSAVAQRWRLCLEPLASMPRVQVTFDGTCVQERELFEVCVRQWRESINDLGEKPRVKVTGYEPMHPPPQCAPLSCINQACLHARSFDFKRCEAFMKSLKHCTLLLHGNEWVTE